jgi:spore maturation protein A
MSYILAAFFVLALVCGGISGRMAEVSAAAMEGAGAAVELCLSMAGAICLWSGVMTLMERGGLSEKLARLLRPVLRRILPRASRDTETMAALSANVSANLLGLGNAATPTGIEAVRQMDGEQEHNPRVRHALYMLLILNATGLQMFPTTVLTLRVAAGSADPNAILLPTLACTAFSTLVGAGLGLLCYRLSGRREGRK